MNNAFLIFLNCAGAFFFGFWSFMAAYYMQTDEHRFGYTLKWWLTALAILNFSSCYAMLLMSLGAIENWCLTVVNFGLWSATIGTFTVHPEVGVKYSFKAFNIFQELKAERNE